MALTTSRKIRPNIETKENLEQSGGIQQNVERNTKRKVKSFTDLQTKERIRGKDAMPSGKTKQGGKTRPLSGMACAPAPKAQAAAPSPKYILGMYNGRIFQSKIASIWKSTSVEKVAAELPAPKVKGTHGNKPKMPVKKPNRPVSSTIQSFRFATETEEEKRAKVSEWRVSKNKTLRRPSVLTTLKPKVSEDDLKQKAITHIHPAVPSESKPEATGQQLDTDTQPKDNLEHEDGACSPEETNCMLNNSAMDAPGSSSLSMNDLVINLREILEAEAITAAKVMPFDDSAKQGIHIGESGSGSDTVKEMEQPSLSDAVALDDKSEWDDFKENDGEGLDKYPGDGRDGSTVRYSLRPTQHMQGMNDTPNAQPGKSIIKNLKFVTPVRRSFRIQVNSPRLPGMLMDHDHTVSSLTDLVKLDDQASAYIFRRNPGFPKSPDKL